MGELEAVFNLIDINGDGYICGQSFPSVPALQYLFKGIDNAAVGPGS